MTSLHRLGLGYGLLFAATGVSLPFAGLWLRSRGLDGAEIGLVLAAPMLARLATGPMLAVWADGFRLRRTPVAVLALTAGAAYALAGLAQGDTRAGFAVLALSWFVAASAAGAIIPLMDVIAIRRARAEGFGFSLARGWGSAAFVAANVIMGGLLLHGSPDLIVGWVVAASLLLAGVAWRILPDEPVSGTASSSPMDRYRGVGRLVADPAFMTAILAVACVQGAHGFYYGFSAILWKGQGIAEPLIGGLWGVSVLAEIGFMWWAEPWLRRRGLGTLTMLGLGAGAALLRWTALAFSPSLAMLWPLQVLHALSFAATYLAGVELVERLAPREHQTAGQTLSSALSSGAVIGAATLASGPLYDRAGALGYLAMAAMAGAGAILTLGLTRRRAGAY